MNVEFIDSHVASLLEMQRGLQEKQASREWQARQHTLRSWHQARVNRAEDSGDESCTFGRVPDPDEKFISRAAGGNWYSHSTPIYPEGTSTVQIFSDYLKDLNAAWPCTRIQYMTLCAEARMDPRTQETMYTHAVHNLCWFFDEQLVQKPHWSYCFASEDEVNAIGKFMAYAVSVYGIDRVRADIFAEQKRAAETETLVKRCSVEDFKDAGDCICEILAEKAAEIAVAAATTVATTVAVTATVAVPAAVPTAVPAAVPVAAAVPAAVAVPVAQVAVKPDFSSNKNPNLFVRSLNVNVSQRDLCDGLKAALSPYGKITDVKVPIDRGTGCPRGFAFITFASPVAAAEALYETEGHLNICRRKCLIDYSK